jgi:hypothetical protein
MKHTITPANLFAPLCTECDDIAAAHGLQPADSFELEGATLRTLTAEGLVKQDCYIGEDAADALHAEIAALLAAAEAARATAEAERIAALPPPRWRVSKDTIIGRIPAESLAAVMGALASQSAAEQFVFLNSAWFWSDNAQLRGLCAALGLDADALLDRDPFLF